MLALQSVVSNSKWTPTPPPETYHILAQYSNDEDYYESSSYTRKKPSKATTSGGGLFQNQKQIGASLLGFGLLFTFLGMMLFFEGNLLRLGNLCIIAGIPLLVGPNRVRQFFSKPSRLQATIITGFGILLVFWGKPRLGILCEIFGLLNLFGNMFPLLLALARRFPIVSNIIDAFEGGKQDKGRGRSQNNPPPRRRGQPKKAYYPDF